MFIGQPGNGSCRENRENSFLGACSWAWEVSGWHTFTGLDGFKKAEGAG